MCVYMQAMKMSQAKRIAEARERLGMNQSELARVLKVTPQSVQKWEKGGDMRSAQRKRLAEALGVSEAYLVSGISEASELVATQLQGSVNYSVPLLKWTDLIDWREKENMSESTVERTPGTLEHQLKGSVSTKLEADWGDLRKGTVVYVDPVHSHQDLINNAFVIVDLGEGEPVIRKVNKEGSQIFLVSVAGLPIQPVEVTEGVQVIGQISGALVNLLPQS